MKESVSKVERQSSEWKKIIANETTDMVCIGQELTTGSCKPSGLYEAGELGEL